MSLPVCCRGTEICATQSKDGYSEYAIHKIETMLKESISQLPAIAPFEEEDATRVAWLVYNSMFTNGRVYHSMNHVFDISAAMKDPILILSALFHDVIYYSIDKEFSEEQSKPLEGVLAPDMQQLRLLADFDDPLVDLVVRLYGFTPGEELPKLGTNEFLSGVIGVRVLAKWLPLPSLIQIAACIEATIPFRPTIDGKSPMDRLYDRLVGVSEDQSEEWHVETVHLAAATANCDLCSFDSDDRDFFLDSSWRLIPEARPILLNEDCPLQEYLNELHALNGRSNFLKGAVPRIFQSFRQVPSDEEMKKKQDKTHENLGFVIQYANVRLLQIMILVDFVIAAGEDPKTLRLRPLLRMTVSQPTEPRDTLSSAELEIRNWLFKGRRECFLWDPAVSALGGYLFDTLGTKGVEEAIQIGKNQKDGSHDLLKHLPQSVVETVGASLAVLLPDKEERFIQVPQSLEIITS